MSGEAEEEGFLARWSRRKRGADEQAQAQAPAQAPAPATATDAPAPAAEPGPEQAIAPGQAARPACPIPNLPEIDLASLPRIEDLTAESDFALFLRPGVPALLRNAALRRMWSLDPAIRDYIGPVEYQWDFNAPGGLPFGFANELGGEVKKLLAQAIGQLGEDDEEVEASPEPEAEARPEPEAEPRPEREGEPVAEPEAAPGAGPEEGAPAALVAEGPTEPGPEPGREPAPEALLPRRRHGGALPA